MGTMLAQRPITMKATPSDRMASTVLIPRVVRCTQCGDLAREDAREHVEGDEVVVRYGCMSCRWHTTRHYHESEL